jgi:DNA helicase II / ATP-dependent DNA helicase PcrA
MERTHSNYQKDILDFVRGGQGHGEVDAKAGSGKTYIGVEATKYIPRGMVPPRVSFLAFNKSIQVELAARLGERAEARTYHSFGLTAMPKRYTIDNFKDSAILKARFGSDLQPIFSVTSRLAGLFKGNLCSDVSEQNVMEYVDHYGLDLGEEGESFFDHVVEGTKELLDPSHVDRLGKINFDDMIWYPLVMNFPIPATDFLLVDEYQDTNMAQMELVMRAAKGRVIAIGDPYQAIYGWRGAGTRGMQIFAERMKATMLPLSITYRCPKAVVAYINQRFPHIPFEAWDQAIEGEVDLAVPQEKMFKQLQSGDMVICRLNAPLVAPAMRLLREGKKAIIKGKDIGKNLITLIHQVERKYGSTTVREFIVDLDEYVRSESEKLRVTQRTAQAELLEDKQQTIYAFAEGATYVNEIKQNIDKIFSDDIEGTVFCTGHKAKGLEADNVYILHPEMFPFKRARTPEGKEQEINLAYVVNTRPRKFLGHVI